MRLQDKFLAVLILLIAAAVRLNAVTYGLAHVCLAVPEEYWQYNSSQSVSLYTWNIAPKDVLPNLPGRIPPTALVTDKTDPINRLVVRLIGCAMGLLTIVFLMRLGYALHARWWWIAGLLVGIAPWFVMSDRWTQQFDTAPLAIAIAALSLWKSGCLPSGWRQTLAVVIHTTATLSLLLIAPPLWWVVGIMLVLQPRSHWRLTLFILLTGIVLIPGLQTPELWLAAAQGWDGGVTAACILIGLLLALWWRPSTSILQTRIMFVLVFFMGSITLYMDSQLPQPNASQWDLIYWLQTRIPDDSIVRFDFATWPLAPIVACPMGADIHFQKQFLGVPFFDTSVFQDPYYFVSTDPKAVANMPYSSQIADQFWVGRGIDLANPVDIGFGDIIHLLNFELLTPTANQFDVVNIRIDYQFGSSITPDVLAYAGYIHLTAQGDPTTNWVNYTDPFIEESGNTGSRRVILNHHIRFALSPKIPAGSYDVRFGVYNIYSGERKGDEIILGTLLIN